jgi:hypothetical protein
VVALVAGLALQQAIYHLLLVLRRAPARRASTDAGVTEDAPPAAEPDPAGAP